MCLLGHGTWHGCHGSGGRREKTEPDAYGVGSGREDEKNEF